MWSVVGQPDGGVIGRTEKPRKKSERRKDLCIAITRSVNHTLNVTAGERSMGPGDN